MLDKLDQYCSFMLLEMLLRKQNEGRNLIGEILVLYGAIAKEEKEEELKLFHRMKTSNN